MEASQELQDRVALDEVLEPAETAAALPGWALAHVAVAHEATSEEAALAACRSTVSLLFEPKTL